MHILLFGGSFDPLHLGHLAVAKAGLMVADQVWLVPCGQHPFDKSMSAQSDRQEILSTQSDFKILLLELEKKRPSYSYETLVELSQLYPEHTFSWLIGSDQVANFSHWHAYAQLLNSFTVYVYPREGSTACELLTGMKWLKNVSPVKFSSTEIKQRVAAGLPIQHLVTPAVANYISRHQLYHT